MAENKARTGCGRWPANDSRKPAGVGPVCDGRHEPVNETIFPAGRNAVETIAAQPSPMIHSRRGAC